MPANPLSMDLVGFCILRKFSYTWFDLQARHEANCAAHKQVKTPIDTSGDLAMSLHFGPRRDQLLVDEPSIANALQVFLSK